MYTANYQQDLEPLEVHTGTIMWHVANNKSEHCHFKRHLAYGNFTFLVMTCTVSAFTAGSTMWQLTTVQSNVMSITEG